ERTGKARSLRDGYRVDGLCRAGRRRAGATLGEGPFDNAADVANVLPGRELGHDPAPLPVDVDLRRDDAGEQPPGTCRVACFFDDGGGRFIAGGLDAEDDQVTPAVPRRAPPPAAQATRCRAPARCRVR